MNSLTADAAVYDSLAMGATLLVRDGIKGKKMELKRAGAVTVAQYAYDKALKDYMSAGISSFTKMPTDNMAVSIAANSLSLAAVFLVTDLLNLTGPKSDISGTEGFIPDGKGKSMSGRVIKAIINAAELVAEQRVVVYTASAVSGMVPPSGPAAAKTM